MSGARWALAVPAALPKPQAYLIFRDSVHQAHHPPRTTSTTHQPPATSVTSHQTALHVALGPREHTHMPRMGEIFFCGARSLENYRSKVQTTAHMEAFRMAVSCGPGQDGRTATGSRRAGRSL